MEPTAVGPGRRYRPLEPLGQDRLGTLWRGVDGRTGLAVTLRLLDPRLTGDARATNRVTGRLLWIDWADADPHLARVLDLDVRHSRASFVVSEPFEGETLARRLEREGPIEIEAAVELAASVASGLSWAHAARVAHGALGASSVLVDGAGAVKVVDVGIGTLAAGGAGRPGDLDSDEARAADVLGVVRLLEELVGTSLETASPAGLSPEAAVAVRRATSPHRSQRPTMAELAAALGATFPAPKARPAGLPVDWAERRTPARASLESGAPATGARRAGSDGGWSSRPTAPRRRGRAVAIAAAAVAAIVVGAIALVALTGGGGQPSSNRPRGTASSTGALRTATVPTLLRLSVDRATAELERAGLVVGRVVSVPGDAGIVVRSEPTQGEAVLAGSEVDLFVGRG